MKKLLKAMNFIVILVLVITLFGCSKKEQTEKDENIQCGINLFFVNIAECALLHDNVVNKKKISGNKHKNQQIFDS